MTTAAALTLPSPAHPSSGGRLVAVDGRALPLTGARLAAEAAAGLARVRLEQRFVNVHADPLTVSYLFPLPHDGAVSGFAFRLDGRRVVGEVDRVASARERYEEALLEGRTAALAEQVRGSVFSQSVGNVPPGAEVVVELTVDQRLAWLPEGAWEWRFPTTVAPRYQGAAGRTPDAARLEVPVADGDLPVRLALDLAVGDALAPGGAVTSPSHALRAQPGPAGRVAFATEAGAALDRDVVVRWPVAGAEVGLSLASGLLPAGARASGRAFGLVTVVPPAGTARALPRDLTVLLDTSGSMCGPPLDQARAVVGALVDSLGDEDRLELIEFSSAPRRWKRAPVAATRSARADARRWLAGLEASGSTEMADAMYEALAPLRPDAQRQVVLVSDGEIGFEREIVAEVLRRLPAGSRLHVVGVGSAVNRSLTAPVARAGRGVEVVVGVDEDPAEGAARLLARTVRPVVTGLCVAGSAVVDHAPARLPDLFGGSPALVSVELRPAGGTLTLTGQTATGPFTRTVTVPAAAGGTGLDAGALAALFAREAVEDLEVSAAAGERRPGIDRAIERLGLDFQIATRLTAWVAISEAQTVDPTRPTRRETMPSALPHGMSVAGLGLRAANAARRQLFAAAPAMEMFDAAPELELRRTRAGGVVGAPPPPAEKSKKEDLGDRVLFQETRRPPRRERDAEEAAEGSAGSAPRELSARLVLSKGARLVLEVLVEDDDLDWAPGDEVEVELADGTVLKARVDAAATTAAGRHGPGALLRLVLDLEAAPASAPQAVVLAGDLVLRIDRVR